MAQGGKLQLASQEVFTVPEGVRHLESADLERLEQAFADWLEAASGPEQLLSRSRLRLMFLLLRHTGARLGEILELAPQSDIDVQGGAVRLGRGRTRREVPVSDKLARALRLVLQDPLLSVGDGSAWFKVDPGYLRRVFYARARDCGLDPGSATPRVLRNSRAIEMLRSGVPLAVVRQMLGQSSTDLTSVYQHFSQGAANSLVRRLALSDLNARTSARNTFVGQVVSSRVDGVMAEVIVETQSGGAICAVITQESLYNLGLEPGTPVAATVKAPLVDVFPQGRIRGGGRNRFSARVTSLRSNGLLTEVSGENGQGVRLCALISEESAQAMELSENDRVEFRFKALSVVLNTV